MQFSLKLPILSSIRLTQWTDSFNSTARQEVLLLSDFCCENKANFGYKATLQFISKSYL